MHAECYTRPHESHASASGKWRPAGREGGGGCRASQLKGGQPSCWRDHALADAPPAIRAGSCPGRKAGLTARGSARPPDWYERVQTKNESTNRSVAWPAVWASERVGGRSDLDGQLAEPVNGTP
jgi:hypothetical protein